MSSPSDESLGTSREGDEPISGFRLERLLGRGNFGEVWRAKAAGVHCALKIVRLGGEYPEVGDREVRSLQLVKRLAHTRICSIQGIWIKDWRGACLDIDNIDKSAIKLGKYQNNEGTIVLDRHQPPMLIVAMRLAQGSIYDQLKSYRASGRRGIPIPELMAYMQDAARGLDYLHDPKDIDGNPLDAVVHCDIKPQNILKHLDEALIGDLGIARRWDRATGMTYKTEGVPNFLTPFYAAPELWSDRPVPATDQYALAITFYQCLTDRLPFSLNRDELRDRTQIMMAHVGGRMRFRKHLEQVEGLTPGQVNRLIDALNRATLPDSAQRFPTCIAFMQAIEQSLQPDGSGSAPVGFGSGSAGSVSPVPSLGGRSMGGSSSGPARVGQATVAPIATVIGSTPSQSLVQSAAQPVDALAGTSALPARDIDTDKTSATVAQLGDATNYTLQPDLHGTSSRTGSRLVAGGVALTLAAIIGVVCWKFLPLGKPEVAKAGPPVPVPSDPDPATDPPAENPAPVQASPVAFAARLTDTNRLIDAGRLADAAAALEVLNPPANMPEAAAIAQVAGARLAAHRGDWEAARQALAPAEADGKPPVEILTATAADAPLAKQALTHRALAEMLGVLVGAEWPVGPLAGAPPELDNARAAAVVEALSLPDTAPLSAAEGWSVEFRALTPLAGQSAQKLVDQLWASDEPAADEYAAVASLLAPVAGENPTWRGALQAAVGGEYGAQLAPLKAMIALSGKLPEGEGQTPDQVIRALAAGEGVPERSEQTERLAVLIAKAAAAETADVARLDLALSALARVTEKLFSPSPAVQQARAQLMSGRLWLAIDEQSPADRAALFARCEQERWESLLKSGGAETAAALALLTTFNAECLSQECQDGAADLADRVRAASDWLNKVPPPADPSPEFAAYRQYVDATIGSYTTDADAAIAQADKLAALYAAAEPAPPLRAADRTARAASRLIRCGQAAVGLPSRDLIEINQELDDLQWKWARPDSADALVGWLTIAAKLAPAGAQPTGAPQLGDGPMRELLLALAKATRPETLGEAASLAAQLIESSDLRNTQLLSIQARDAVADFDALRRPGGS